MAKPTPASPKKRKASLPEVKALERKIVYPEIDAQKALGKNAINSDRAKELLGWETESDYIARKMLEHPGATADKFKWKEGEYLFIDEEKNKVRCSKNTRNRPVTESWVRTLAQEHLNKRWRFNGEAIIIGNCEEVLSGQHRLLSVIIAEQIRKKNKVQYEELWPGEVTMETLVVYGIDEHDDIVNTLDTGKPRSLEDVLFRSDFYKNLKYDERRRKAKILAAAVKLLWERTGLKTQIMTRNQTHAESLAFINNHQRLLKAVNHIYEENVNQAVNGTELVTEGTAAGLMYLMGAAATDGDFYRQKTTGEFRSEKDIDFKCWKKAEEFWLKICTKSSYLEPMREIIRRLFKSDVGQTVNTDEKMAVILKSWLTFVKKPDKLSPKEEEEWFEENFKTKAIKPRFHIDGEGYRNLIEMPDIGGIDTGDRSFDGVRKEVEQMEADDDEEILEEKEEDIDEEERKAHARRAKNLKDKGLKAMEEPKANGEDEEGDGPLDRLLKRPHIVPPKAPVNGEEGEPAKEDEEEEVAPRKKTPAKAPPARRTGNERSQHGHGAR